MSTRSLVIVGGGEHARVVADAARSRPDLWRVLGYAAPAPADGSGPEPLLGAWLGTDEAVLAEADPGRSFVLGCGALAPSPLRREVAERFEAAGVAWATVVHERAIVAGSAVLEPGAVVMAGAVVNPGARVGRHAVVNTGALVEHDVVLEEFVMAGPGAAIGGGARAGAGAFLGLGCRIRDHVAIGAGATVAMGAVVVNAVPAGAVVFGVPARAKGKPDV